MDTCKGHRLDLIGKDNNILLSSVDILVFALVLFSIGQLYVISYR